MPRENESGEEKTENPTGRQQKKLRQQGSVAQSKDLSMLVNMVAAFYALKLLAPGMWEDFQRITAGAFTSIYSTTPITMQAVKFESLKIMGSLGLKVLLVMLISAFFGSLSTVLQTNFLWTLKPLRPKFSKLNPVNGLKRIISARNSIQVAKSIAKLAIIGPIAYFSFVERFPEFFTLMNVPIADLFPYATLVSTEIFKKIVAFFLVLAILDYLYNRWDMAQNNKMTKTEVKDERKSIEGDEATKRRIRAAGLGRIRQQILEMVPSADVVVTNPTHYAVALKYDPALGSAPRVIAKGRSHLAQRIKEIARENGVPVIERKPLARALFKAVEIGQEIPYELYRAVAELLAYVYRLKRHNPLNNRADKNETQSAFAR